jgi:hypothetical protein
MKLPLNAVIKFLNVCAKGASNEVEGLVVHKRPDRVSHDTNIRISIPPLGQSYSFPWLGFVSPVSVCVVW